MEKGGYMKFSELTKIKSTKLQEKPGVIKIQDKPGEEPAEQQEVDREDTSKVKAKEYDYLLSMSMWTLTYERVEELKRQQKDKLRQLKELEATTEKDLWRRDLKDFINELEIVEKIELDEQLKAEKMKGSKGKAKKARKKISKKNFSSDSEA